MDIREQHACSAPDSAAVLRVSKPEAAAIPSVKRAALATVTVSESNRLPLLPQFLMTMEVLPIPACQSQNSSKVNFVQCLLQSAMFSQVQKFCIMGTHWLELAAAIKA